MTLQAFAAGHFRSAAERLSLYEAGERGLNFIIAGRIVDHMTQILIAGKL